VQERTTTAVDIGPSTRPVGAVIRAIDTRCTPSELHLSGGSCFLGTGPKSSMVIDDPSVSRLHAEIRLCREGVLVRDLGSRNGTFFQGQRLGELTLAFGGEIRLANARFQIDADLAELAETSASNIEMFRGLVGRSDVMRRLFGIVARLDGSLANVLVLGESGVGKELFARAIHQGSAVSEGPFVAINCGAMQKELVASQLFGHKKGAFTGAADARKGAFVQAHGGTLFLDEIGELPIDVQPVLLRTLELGEVTPVGGDVPQKVSVRVIAATNRDLRERMTAGEFREDLYYRLAVIPLVVPPLRDRREDLPVLAGYFIRQEGLGELPPEVLTELAARAWPGNVRELRNVIQAYSALGMLPTDPRRAQLVETALLDFVDVTKPYHEQKEALAEAFQRLYLRALLDSTRGNQTAAAKASGLDRAHLNRLLQKYGMR
jgi:transcriptional regulator with GAF, ATPase, and Fis domain